MEYADLDFVIPTEQNDYAACSQFVTGQIGQIVQNMIQAGSNRIIINTNLKLGLPMENINKVAGPFVEAWAQEIFAEVASDNNNAFHLIAVATQKRLHMADIILEFERKDLGPSSLLAHVDVKATAINILNSGRGPNITSYARIRTAYVQDPNYLFIILSLKHHVYSVQDTSTQMSNGIMEISSFQVYDLKYISDTDLLYNPALGTGQLQLRDVSHVVTVQRTTWEFCQMLDRKYLASKKGLVGWLTLAKNGGWIR